MIIKTHKDVEIKLNAEEFTIFMETIDTTILALNKGMNVGALSLLTVPRDIALLTIIRAKAVEAGVKVCDCSDCATKRKRGFDPRDN